MTLFGVSLACHAGDLTGNLLPRTTALPAAYHATNHATKLLCVDNSRLISMDHNRAESLHPHHPLLFELRMAGHLKLEEPTSEALAKEDRRQAFCSMQSSNRH
ncbi:hypothetical protein [Mesorhizobium sp. M2A.F.Ca.ET.067.02.1.1]|uniref:hypothetical protein n=1 Tax=Mesorhizobium sp. M2A.F.Ca.ET.067.02.1.1 TaxID=2496749 RepID=UPI000FEBB18E|nr:hypothetical protein [Mesorhizobium sp. M2A.F.Ca.ET.067.02.1.1]